MSPPSAAVAAPAVEPPPAVSTTQPGSPEKTTATPTIDARESDSRQKLVQFQQQLDEANQALEKSGASVAELTAENDRLEKELKAAQRAALPTVKSTDSLPVVRHDPTDLAALREERASLREENNRLRQAGSETSAFRLKNEQLARENEQLNASLVSQRRELDQSQGRLAELQKQLDAVKAGQPMADSPPPVSVEAGASVEKLTTTVAELTAANDKLEKDLESARKSTYAALAAQSQAVTVAQPDVPSFQSGGACVWILGSRRRGAPWNDGSLTAAAPRGIPTSPPTARRRQR